MGEGGLVSWSTICIEVREGAYSSILTGGRQFDMVGEVSFVVSAALYCTVLYCTLLAQLSPIVSSLAHSNTREVVCGDGLWGLGGKSFTGFPKSSLPAAGMCVLAYHGDGQGYGFRRKV